MKVCIWATSAFKKFLDLGLGGLVSAKSGFGPNFQIRWESHLLVGEGLKFSLAFQAPIFSEPQKRNAHPEKPPTKKNAQKRYPDLLDIDEGLHMALLAAKNFLFQLLRKAEDIF